MMAINFEPVFQGCYRDDHPLTEDLDLSNDDLTAFVHQKRKHSRKQYSSSSSSSNKECQDFCDTEETAMETGPPAKQMQFPSGKFPRENYIFVANLTKNMRERYLVETFQRFGKIRDVSVICRDASSQPFAYVAFEDVSSAVKAQSLVEVPAARDPGHLFRVEPRKTFPFMNHIRNQQMQSSAAAAAEAAAAADPAPAQPPNPIICEPPAPAAISPARNISPRSSIDYEIGNVTIGGDCSWLRELENFDWKSCASKYLYRTVTMEDYLVEYIHTQASYREIGQESVDDMVGRLTHFAESKPVDLTEMMPPSVSGVVYNMTRDSGAGFLETLATLLPIDKFKIRGDVSGSHMVHYLDCLSPALAKQKLKEILVEGVFVYFFAKFCHGPTFKIKMSFYQRSEPVKSCLLAITGADDVTDAIHTYFNWYSDIFCFDYVTGDLTMTRDYFDKNHKDEMKAYLEGPSHKHPHSNPSNPNNNNYKRQRRMSYMAPTLPLKGAPTVAAPPPLQRAPVTSPPPLQRAPVTSPPPLQRAPVTSPPPLQRAPITAAPILHVATAPQVAPAGAAPPPQQTKNHPPLSSPPTQSQWRDLPAAAATSSSPPKPRGQSPEKQPTFKSGGGKHGGGGGPREICTVGYVKRIDQDHIHGEVSFKSGDGRQVAHFKRKDTYIDGKRMTADMRLRDYLAPGNKVGFKASLNGALGASAYTCSLVWSGKAPPFIEKRLAAGYLKTAGLTGSGAVELTGSGAVRSTGSGAAARSASEPPRGEIPNQQEKVEEEQQQPDSVIFRGVRARIRCVDAANQTGFARFAHGTDAFFSKEAFGPGFPAVTLSDVGREVMLDIAEQSGGEGQNHQSNDRGVRTYKAIAMWYPEMEVESVVQQTQEHMNQQTEMEEVHRRHMDELLEPVESVTDPFIWPMGMFNDEGEGADHPSPPLPTSVESVVQFVLREDAQRSFERKLLSNPVAVDNVINRLTNLRIIDTLERSEIKMRIESEMRHVLAKILAEWAV